MSQTFLVRPIIDSDRGWVRTILRDYWGSDEIITRGRSVDAGCLPGFMAVLDDERVGLVTFNIRENECEVVSLNSLKPGIGIGSALVQAVTQNAERVRCKRVWLITTNDNLAALGFYQKRGMHLAAIYPDALAQSRKLTSEIPTVGLDGIPMRDEIELEYILE